MGALGGVCVQVCHDGDMVIVMVELRLYLV